MDAHLAKEIGGEFLYGCCADDELAIHAHEALQVELALYFFECHIQRVVIAF